LDQGKSGGSEVWHEINNIADVPLDRDLLLAVITGDEVHALTFPCRRAGYMWISSKTNRPVVIYPTHWQEWRVEP
jgi:hypothetical protein